MTHYTTLGVDAQTSDSDIKKAYRKLASQHHPDKGGDTTTFQNIQVAYDTLSDPQKRAQYDRQISGRQEFDFGAGSVSQEEMFEALRRQFSTQFGGGFGGFTHTQQPRANQNVRIAVEISLADTLETHTKTLNVSLPGGQKETLQITVPRGIQHGSTMMYSGLGSNQIKGVPRGDLQVQFHVRPHPPFEQQGVDLYVGMSVNCFEAIVGCEREIVGIDGRTFKINIPPGSQAGNKLGIPNAGVYVHGHAMRGKIIVVIQIVIPTTLSDSDKELVKQLQSRV